MKMKISMKTFIGMNVKISEKRSKSYSLQIIQKIDREKFKEELKQKLNQGIDDYESFESIFLEVSNKHASLTTTQIVIKEKEKVTNDDLKLSNECSNFFQNMASLISFIEKQQIPVIQINSLSLSSKIIPVP